MTWVEVPPASVGPLERALDLYRTQPCRTLAEAYAALLVRTGGRLPTKAEFDVTTVPSAIPHLALCAVTRPDRCIYRVAGDALQARIGFNPTGQNYYDFVPPERRAVAARAMNMVVEVPCAFRAEIEQNYTSGVRRMVEATGFPLRSEEPGIDGFIIFADTAIEPVLPLGPVDVRLLGANVTRRDLIDVGFGVDEGFRDLLRVT